MQIHNARLISLVVVAAVAAMLPRETPAADVPQIDLSERMPPSIGSVADDAFGVPPDRSACIGGHRTEPYEQKTQ